MSEGIDFNDDGTITVRFDGQTWTISRPKFAHWRKYSRAFTESAERAIAPLRAALDDIKKAEADGDEGALTEATKRFNGINSEDLMLAENERLLRDIFAELADRPLPDSVDDWPAWLILPPARNDNGQPGAAIPARIVGHWRNVPKASSKTPTG